MTRDFDAVYRAARAKLAGGFVRRARYKVLFAGVFAGFGAGVIAPEATDPFLSLSLLLVAVVLYVCRTCD